MEEPPVRPHIETGRDVVPLHYSGPTEPQWIRGSPHHESGPEGSLGGGVHVPAAVSTPLALHLIRGGSPLEAELGLLVSQGRQVVVTHEVRGRARHLLEHSLSCAG